MQKKSDLFNNNEYDYRQNWMTSFVTNKTIITKKNNSKTLSRYLKSIFIDIINVDMRLSKKNLGTHYSSYMRDDTCTVLGITSA